MFLAVVCPVLLLEIKIYITGKMQWRKNTWLITGFSVLLRLYVLLQWFQYKWLHLENVNSTFIDTRHRNVSIFMYKLKCFFR